MSTPRIVRAAEMAGHGLTQHALRTRYRRVHPGVWVRRDVELDALVRAEAAWHWTGGDAILGGYSAAAVHGVKYLPRDADAVLILSTHRRCTPGIEVRRHSVAPDEVCRKLNMTATTPQRTALDLCSWLGETAAIEAVDALYQATGLTRGALPISPVDAILALTDEGAESIWETRTRLFLVRAGLPRPSSQVTVFGLSGNWIGRFDLVYEKAKLIIEYDGDQHFEPAQRNRDVVRWNALVEAGWTLIRVKASQLANHPEVLLRQIRSALGL